MEILWESWGISEELKDNFKEIVELGYKGRKLTGVMIISDLEIVPIAVHGRNKSIRVKY